MGGNEFLYFENKNKKSYGKNYKHNYPVSIIHDRLCPGKEKGQK